MDLTDVVDETPSWLGEDEIAFVRDRVPIVYVEAVPVRLDHLGHVERVGTLLRAMPDGLVSRAVVGGRVLINESIRDAMWRHLTKDLGPECEPQLPASATPFTVLEYFPSPARKGYTDARQHAVALAYIVPCLGTPEPSAEMLDFSWLTVDEATNPAVVGEMSDGHRRLVQLALAHTQRLP